MADSGGGGYRWGRTGENPFGGQNAIFGKVICPVGSHGYRRSFTFLMKPLPLSVFPLACAAFFTGCSPKQPQKPQVDADVAAAHSAANEGQVAATPSPMAASAAEPHGAALPVLGPAPTWKLKDLNGREITSNDFKGKVLVIDFWATWCPPCREEIPGYVQLYKKYGPDRLAIIGVSLDEAGPAVVKDFVRKFGVTYPIVMGDDAVQTAFGNMEAIPTTFLIDPSGQIRDKKVGAEPTAEYEKKIASLLE